MCYNKLFEYLAVVFYYCSSVPFLFYFLTQRILGTLTGLIIFLVFYLYQRYLRLKIKRKIFEYKYLYKHQSYKLFRVKIPLINALLILFFLMVLNFEIKPSFYYLIVIFILLIYIVFSGFLYLYLFPNAIQSSNIDFFMISLSLLSGVIFSYFYILYIAPLSGFFVKKDIFLNKSYCNFLLSQKYIPMDNKTLQMCNNYCILHNAIIFGEDKTYFYIHLELSFLKKAKKNKTIIGYSFPIKKEYILQPPIISFRKN